MGPLPEEFCKVDSRNLDVQCFYFFLSQFFGHVTIERLNKGLRLRSIYIGGAQEKEGHFHCTTYKLFESFEMRC